MDDYILQGGGEHARVVLDALLTSGQSVRALFDPKYTGTLMNVPQRGKYEPNAEPGAKAIIAIGDNSVRKHVASLTRHPFGRVVHPSAVVSPFAEIDEGSMILHGVIVQPFSKIGRHVILNTGSQVDHDCKLADFVHLAPGAVLCGTVMVGEGALIGAGSIVLPGRRVGAWSVVGAGSVVTQDVPEGIVVMGNPAKPKNLKR